MRSRVIRGAALASIAIAVACGIGIEGTGELFDGGGAEAGSLDGSVFGDAGHLGDEGRWTFIDLDALLGVRFAFTGGAYDGARYVYFTPFNGPVTRYDTTAPLASASSWEQVDLSATYPGVHWVGAAVDDGQLVFPGYVTTLPDAANIPERRWLVYDPALPFEAGASFSTEVPLAAGGYLGAARGASSIFAAAFIDHAVTSRPLGSDAGADLRGANRCAYAGGAFANGAFYFAPFACPFGRLVDAPDAALDQFDYFATLDAGSDGGSPARMSYGAVSDGRYVYFVPYQTPGGAFSGVVTRVDSNLPIGQPSTFTSFDLASIDPHALGYIGGAFDGRFVYFAPYFEKSGAPNSRFVRFDTRASFDSPSSWEIVPATALGATLDAGADAGDGAPVSGTGSFFGAVFDGKNIYFIPVNSPHLLAVFRAYDQQTPLPAGIFAGTP